VFWCLSLGDALTFVTLKFSFPSSNVFLHYTLRTMCNSSLGGMEKHSAHLFVYLYLSFCSKKKNCAMLFVKFELNRNCGLHFISLL
jgi:hypothetical protein